jgi:hypothetical protein
VLTPLDPIRIAGERGNAPPTEGGAGGKVKALQGLGQRQVRFLEVAAQAFAGAVGQLLLAQGPSGIGRASPGAPERSSPPLAPGGR